MMITGMLLGGLMVGAFAFNGTEPVTAQNPLIPRYFDKLDANADGVITVDEFIAKATRQGALKYVPAIRYDVGSSLPGFFAAGDVGFTAEKINVSNGTFDIKYTATAKNLVWDSPECRASLAEISNGEIAREFYALDSNADNQLDLSELEKTRILPPLSQLEREYKILDNNADNYLRQSEIEAVFEQALTWHKGRGVLVLSIHKEVQRPKTCMVDEQAKAQDATVTMIWTFGRPSFQMLQEKNGGGIPDDLFTFLDANSDKRLNFNEFISWYL